MCLYIYYTIIYCWDIQQKSVKKKPASKNLPRNPLRQSQSRRPRGPQGDSQPDATVSRAELSEAEVSFKKMAQLTSYKWDYFMELYIYINPFISVSWAITLWGYPISSRIRPFFVFFGFRESLCAETPSEMTNKKKANLDSMAISGT